MADKSKGKADQRPQRQSFLGMRIRRGRDGKWHFHGQEDGEEVRLIVRKYWVFLVEKIQQIGIEFKEPWGYILKYGLIHLYLAGSDFFIEDIADPRRIRDAIEGVTKEFKESKPKEGPVPRPKDPVIADTLEKL